MGEQAEKGLKRARRCARNDCQGAMGNKCGKHAEVRTLSRRGSKKDLASSALEACHVQKSKKKRRKPKKKRRWRLKKGNKSSSKQGAKTSGSPDPISE